MKKLLTILTLVTFGLPQVYNQNSIVSIPDNNFLNALINLGLDTNEDGKISYAEAEAVTGLQVYGSAISDLTGIDAFINLDTLDCTDNELTTLDVSYNNNLGFLDCSYNKLTALDFSDNGALNHLDCSYNELNSLNVSNNLVLSKLNCYGNKLAELDVTYNASLTELWCSYNDLTTLDVSQNTALSSLSCKNNKLANLDVSNNAALTRLWCQYNQLSVLDISKNTALTELWCDFNKLYSLDASNNINLEILGCGGNNMITLDVSGNINLTKFNIKDMPGLTYVCVDALPFPPEGVEVYTSGSRNAQFSTVCFPPILTVKSQPNPDHVEVKSSKDGIIWLLPGKCDRILDSICNSCIDSVWCLANTSVDFCLDSCKVNGEYWLYASDADGNVSEPVPVSFEITEVTIGGMDRPLRIYPNPSNSILIVETNTSDPCTIEIFSLVGQLICKREMEGTTLQLNISSFPRGEYLITIRSKGFARTEKFIKL